MKSADSKRRGSERCQAPPFGLRLTDRKISSSPTTRQSSPMASQVELPVMKLPLMKPAP